MSIKIGNTTPSTLYLGSTEIQKAYLGSDLVWDKTSSFLLDTYPAFFGVSNRQLKTGVTDVINVRESGSNVEQGFTPTEITDGTLTTFTGANDGLVVEPIDQSGNSYVVEQTVANDQPLIVDGGSLVTSGGLPAWDNANGQGWKSTANLNLSGESEVWMFTVLDYTKTSENQFLYDTDSLSNGNRLIVAFGDVNNTFDVSLFDGSGATISTNNYNLPSDGRVLISVRVRESSDAVFTEVYFNGVSQTCIGDTGGASVSFGSNQISILNNKNNNKPFDGNTQEFLLYKGDQSSNRDAIETDINDYYSIY